MAAIIQIGRKLATVKPILYSFAVNFECLYFEIDSNSRYKSLIEGIVGKAKQKTGLPHTRIANKQKFEEVVVSAS